MKNLLWLLLCFCSGCNTVKKTSDKKEIVSHAASTAIADSTSVSKELKRLHSAYFSDDNKSLSISFFQDSGSVMDQPIILEDSAGKFVLHLGGREPASLHFKMHAIDLGSKEISSAGTDSARILRHDKSVVDTKDTTVKEEKKSSRVPWYLITIVSILVILFGYTLFRMTK